MVIIYRAEFGGFAGVLRSGSGLRQTPGIVSRVAASRRSRKRIEEVFGWIKTVAGLRHPKLRGRAKIAWAFFAAVADNLVRAPSCWQHRHDRPCRL